jgi:hypothetical protein
VRAIERAVAAHPTGSGRLLIVAGTGRLVTEFLDRWTHPGLVRPAVPGNHANDSLADLHALSWAAVQDFVRREDQQAVEDWRQALSWNKATDEITSIGLDAVRGRVRRLLVAQSGELRGHFDAANGQVELRSGSARTGEEDTLDAIIECVLRHGGEVIPLAPDSMPTGSPLAALFRW